MHASRLRVGLARNVATTTEAAGLTRSSQRLDWRTVAGFYPWKFTSLMTIARRVRITTGLALSLGQVEEPGVRLQFGRSVLACKKLLADQAMPL